MNIGEAAAASGLRAKTIRYYEEIGLVEPAKRGKGGYRQYGPSDVAMLRFVARARDLGFSLAETTKLLSLYKDKRRTSAAVRDLTVSHIADVDQKLRQLQALRRALQHLVDHCHGDSRPECPILEDIVGGEPESASKYGTDGSDREPDALARARGDGQPSRG